MRIEITTVLDVAAERAWEAVRQPRLLDHVAWPLQSFEHVDPPTWPALWIEGSYDVRLRLFGAVPMGRQRVMIRDMVAGPDRYGLRDDGYGDLARRWDHVISIEPISSSTCRYTDRIDVRAGLLTPLVAAFAQIFYRHRQRRWRALVASNFAPLATGARA